MLAVVQPYSASPDVGHRARSTLSSTSRSSSSNLASLHHPSLQRHQTTSTAHPPPKKTSTPPLRPLTPTLPSLSAPHLPFDIHSYPATDLLKLLALLLTHIATTNDHLSRPSPLSSGSSSSNSSPSPDSTDPPPIWHTLTTASRGAISTPAATLTFHARNIPTISLEAYLLRILKYCPTTNHVFLSLLVYFDRMSKLSEDSVGRAFVIDSYNIHRLVIAGVTVASKFFSDVFYTNSRYAKVGGLPLPELNQLELQFLLLNDFRLVISSTEMQHYAEQLILFSKSSNSNATLPTRANGSNSSHTITAASFKKQLQETGGSVSDKPLVVHPHPSSSFRSTISPFPGAPKCPFDALGCVPTPVLPNSVNHSSAYHSQTHVPVYSHIRTNGPAHLSSSSLSSHSSSHLDPQSLSHYRSQPQLHSQPHHQHHHNQTQNRLHHNRLASSSSISSTSRDIDVPDPDPETDAEDADTSTDAGTETDTGSETDEEPTIKAPPTVAGSVGSAASEGAGSVWGDEADERMASP